MKAWKVAKAEDSEVELAAVITYSRQAWGNAEAGDGEIVIPKDIVDYKKPKI